MKRIIDLFIFILITSSVFSQNTDDFIIDNFVKTSHVKNQYNSNACWSFSTTSFIEAEIKRIYNNDVELSPMFFVYFNYILQSDNYLNKNGHARFSPGGLSFHAMNVYDKYGVIPTNTFEAKFKNISCYDYEVVYNPIKSILDSALQTRSEKSKVLAEVKKCLNKNISIIPDKFSYQDSIFSPIEFKNRIGKINSADYYAFTSYQDLGFYKKCILPIPANWTNESYYNIPIKEFLEIVNYALKNNFTLLWDGDVTEYPIITDQGVNFNVKKVDLFQFPNDTTITDSLRQKTFNNKSTTEDHNSLLVGIAQDKMDNRYFILKDSNGDENFSKGFIYISENYLALKTISIIVHKDGIPVNIKKKLMMNNE